MVLPSGLIASARTYEVGPPACTRRIGSFWPGAISGSGASARAAPTQVNSPTTSKPRAFMRTFLAFTFENMGQFWCAVLQPGCAILYPDMRIGGSKGTEARPALKIHTG